MIKTAVLVLAFAAVCASALPASVFETRYTREEATDLFSKWAEKFEKVYEEAEKEMRLGVFHDNLEFVHRHNAEEALGLQTYKVALNEFADLTSEEFKVRLGFKYDANAIRNEVYLNGTAASSVDWRKKGAVTPVKNQGQCGSCWSFSATGSMEGANFLKTGKLVSLSEQELVDCDKVDQGCNGGMMDNAFDFVEKNGGIDTEKDYPYTATGGMCSTQKERKDVGKVTGHTDVPANNEKQLELAVNKQPVSVAIEADQSGFQLYHSGVFSGACGTQLDHGVLVVGYGEMSGQKYWTVKNSWGAAWGQQGYILLAKEAGAKQGQCGVAMMASYPQA